jgi:hypothetical protein
VLPDILRVGGAEPGQGRIVRNGDEAAAEATGTSAPNPPFGAATGGPSVDQERGQIGGSRKSATSPQRWVGRKHPLAVSRICFHEQRLSPHQPFGCFEVLTLPDRDKAQPCICQHMDAPLG